MGFSEHLDNLPFLKTIISFVSNFILKIIRRISQIGSSNQTNLVIISLHKLGDTVFTFPVVEEIVRRNPNRKIIILCYDSSKDLYEKFFRVEVETLNRGNFFLNDRIAKSGARKKLRKLEPAILYDITGVMTSASLIFNSSSSQIIGTNRDIFRSIYSKYNTIENVKYSSDIYLKAVGIKSNENSYKFEIKAKYDKSYHILIHPFAGWNSKEWNFNKYIELCLKLNNVHKCAFLIQEGSLNKSRIKYLDSQGITIILTRSTNDLMQEINKCSLLISNDTGPIQIAAIMGKPTFTIYGPTNPLFHLPRGNGHRFIIHKIKCSPQGNERLCYTYGGKNGCFSFECLNLLQVNEVFASIKSFLEDLEIQGQK
ncbi:MAG: glycosyltransferase family 9 protein [Ignavibacteriaceae bacterium]|nr:glycosyltransferase family 9 protein [Ignavibacteriaceae bacterium]